MYLGCDLGWPYMRFGIHPDNQIGQMGLSEDLGLNNSVFRRTHLKMRTKLTVWNEVNWAVSDPAILVVGYPDWNVVSVHK